MTTVIVMWMRFCQWRQARWRDRAERALERADAWEDQWRAWVRWAKRQEAERARRQMEDTTT